MSDARRGRGRLPDFLIIGAAKSGTTSLAVWLDAHTDVFVLPRKESHFFSRESVWERGIDWYASQFAEADDGVQLVGEATPNYLSHPLAAPRIAEALPNVRTVAILRDPVERAWSHYVYDRDAGHSPERFEEIVQTAGQTAEHYYVRMGRYVQHLRRWSTLVPREQLLVLWFDDLRDRPEQVWRDVCGFLDLEPDPVPQAVGSRHNRHYRRRLPIVMSAMRLGQTWRRLPRVARRLDRAARLEADYEPLPPVAQARLRATYADDNRELAKWLGQPLPPSWST
jgi:hypothetical protein